MSIAFDATSNSGPKNSVNYSWAHTCTGSNRLLIVALTTSTVAPTSAPSYNAAPMTLITSSLSGSNFVYLYYLVAPTTGINSISVAFPTPLSTVGAAVSFTGVDQLFPIDVSAVGGATSATSSSISLTTTTNQDYIVDAIAVSGTGTGLTPGGSQVQEWNVDNGSNFTSGGSILGPVSTGSNTMSWTFSFNNWSSAAVAIRAAFLPLPGLMIQSTTPVFLRNEVVDY